jgi:uncharacterized integral membrane protein
LVEVLRVWIVILLIVVHVIHVVIGVGCVYLVLLAWIFELPDLKSLLDQYVLHVVR